MGIISSAMLHSWEEMGWLDNDNSEELEQLKAENERLKQELATYGATGICETCTDKANKQADKYYKTLQEIKAIAEGIFVEGDMSNTYRIVNDLKKIITKAGSEG